MSQERSKQIAVTVVGGIIIAYFSWQLSLYTEKTNQLNRTLHELESQKASINYVDKENYRQDQNARRVEDKLSKQLDYIIKRLDEMK